MSVDISSLEAYANLKRLGEDEQIIAAVLDEIGPSTDKRLMEALNQREAKSLKIKKHRRNWQINQVTGRRNGCVGKGWVVRAGHYRRGGKGKMLSIWKLTHDTRQPAGDWVKVPDNEVAAIKKTVEKQNRHFPKKQEAKVYSPSDHGRALAACRVAKKRRINQKTSQMRLF